MAAGEGASSASHQGKKKVPALAGGLNLLPGGSWQHNSSGKKANSVPCLQLLYYAALMKNALEDLQKAHGKELPNGINHLK